MNGLSIMLDLSIIGPRDDIRLALVSIEPTSGETGQSSERARRDGHQPSGRRLETGTDAQHARGVYDGLCRRTRSNPIGLGLGVRCAMNSGSLDQRIALACR